MCLALVLSALLPAGMSTAEEGTARDTGPTEAPVISSQVTVKSMSAGCGSSESHS